MLRIDLSIRRELLRGLARFRMPGLGRLLADAHRARAMTRIRRSR